MHDNIREREVVDNTFSLVEHESRLVFSRSNCRFGYGCRGDSIVEFLRKRGA